MRARLALELIADHLAVLATSQGGERSAYRVLLYDLLGTLPRPQQGVAYSILSGLESEWPNIWRLLKGDSRKPLSHLPRPLPIVSATGRVQIAIVGELCFRDFTPELDAIKKAREVFLAIDSQGGDGHVGLQFADALRGKRSTGIVFKDCFSTAMSILQACEHRQAITGSTLMVHAPVTFSVGRIDQLKADIARLEQLQEQTLALYHRCPQARSWFEDGLDHFFTAEQALAIGLIDQIIAPATPQGATSTVVQGTQAQPEDPNRDATAVLEAILLRARSQFTSEQSFNEAISRHGQAKFAVGSP